MNKLEIVAQALDNIDLDLPYEEQLKDKVYDLVDLLVDEYYYKENLADLIYECTDNSTDLNKVARVLDVLNWSVPESDTSLKSTFSKWLKSDNARKVEIILRRHDTPPYPTHEENESELNMLKAKFPSLSQLCDYWIDATDEKKSKARGYKWIGPPPASTRL